MSPIIIIYADEHTLGSCGVTHGAEKVEQRAFAYGFAGRANKAHGGVMVGREEETDPCFIHAFCCFLRRDGKVDAKLG